MSTVKLSSEHWTIVFSKNEAVANCLPWRTTTGIVKTLERGEYCKRRPHPSDGRRVVVEVTTKGRDLMQEIYPLFHQLENEAVSQLGEADLDATKDALRTILATVDGSE